MHDILMLSCIQVVVGLDIEYGKKESRKATLSVWRAYVAGNEIKVAPEIVDEVRRITWQAFSVQIR